jgi:transposase InsO family protein
MSTKKTKQPTRATKTARRDEPLQPAKGRRFTLAQKMHALTLVVAGMKRVAVAETVGTTTVSLGRWYNEAEASGTLPKPPRSGGATASATEPVAAEKASRSKTTKATKATKNSLYAPRDPGQGLSEAEQAAILELKKRHPSMGPAQIRAQLKRFKGWRLSVKAIARVLRAHGYEPVHTHGRPQGPEPQRFEAPRRNALWQMDFAELRVGGHRQHVLLVLDDFSRFCVGHALCEEPSAEAVIATLETAIARHGKPEAVRTDRGGGFISKELGAYLERELIDHVVGRAYHPQGGGKVESLVGTLKRELWEVEHFDDWSIAKRRLDTFVADYNERRAHMGIDGLTPADRFFARADRVLATIDALSRRRNGALAMHAAPGAPVEEIASGDTGAPLEALRLVVVDGHMELRLCGSRVILGAVES